MVAAARHKAKKHRSSVSWASLASYVGVFVLVLSLVALGYHPPVKTEGSLASVSVAEPTKNDNPSKVSTTATVDQLLATNIAATLAESADLPITYNVNNLSQSLAVESVLAQNDTNVITKPQIVQPTADTNSVKKYVVVAGDTVQSVATKFNVSPQTVKWSNNLTADTLEPGKELTIPPVDGVLYTVKSGDTIDSIASKYKANRNIVIARNDLDLTGNPAPGQQLLIPDGALPTEEQPGYVAPRATVAAPTGSYGGGYGSSYTGNISVGNKYAWGNCTWYAYERRAQLGNPIGSFWGNASSWAYMGAAAGFLVDGNPTPGAIMQNGGGYGHVAIVESINPGVSVSISEMNGYRFGGGFARVGHGDIPWGEAVSGYYRYIH